MSWAGERGVAVAGVIESGARRGDGWRERSSETESCRLPVPGRHLRRRLRRPANSEQRPQR
jgi:hypothetical protein